MFLLLQLADSAFPAGGFAHSGGLEAAAAAGLLGGEPAVAAALAASVAQVGRGALPFVGAAWDGGAAEADLRSEAFLVGHVARRASVTQGRALLDAARRVLGEARGLTLPRGHHAPTFGAIGRAVGLPRRETLGAYLHLAARNVASAAVRLGLVGPYAAQRMLAEAAPRFEATLDRCGGLGLDDARQAAPLLDLAQGAQDRLYSRLFQS